MTTVPDCSVKHDLQFGRNRAVISFPAECFGSPRWIQRNAFILTMDNRRHPSYLYVDDLYPVFETNPGDVEQFSKRIPRG